MSDLALDHRSLEARLPASPWTGRASSGAAGCSVLSLVGVVIGWAGVSKSSTFSDAQPWFFVGVLALLIGFAAAVLWLNSAARRTRLVRLECHDILRRDYGLGTELVAPPSASPPRYVRAAGMVKVHKDSCELIVGKKFDEVLVGPDAQRCGVCCP
jgi:hypothetical protein